MSVVTRIYRSIQQLGNRISTERTMGQAAAIARSIGQPGDTNTLAEIENGPQQRNQIYKCLGPDAHIHHLEYVCDCGGATTIPNGLASLTHTYLCGNCSKPFCMETWLCGWMAAQRLINGNPKTAVEQPYAPGERQIADNRLPARWIVSKHGQQQAKMDAIARQLDGGMHDKDESVYEAADAGGGSVGFGDPMAANAGGRLNTAQQHAAYNAYLERRTAFINQGRTPEQQVQHEQRQRARDEAYQRDINDARR